jgi:hypothetical protein
MATRIYDFNADKARAREREELADAISEITLAVKTIAEELRRDSLIRTASAIDRRERKARRPR